RVEARLVERAPDKEREASAPRREREPAAEQPTPALIVTLERARLRQAEAEAAPPRTDEKDVLARLQPESRDWSNERVFAVRLRIPTGAEQIEALGLDAEETARVVQRAVDR